MIIITIFFQFFTKFLHIFLFFWNFEDILDPKLILKKILSLCTSVSGLWLISHDICSWKTISGQNDPESPYMQVFGFHIFSLWKI